MFINGRKAGDIDIKIILIIIIDWKLFISTLRENGCDHLLSIEHEDPVWKRSEEKIKTGLQLGLKHLSQFES